MTWPVLKGAEAIPQINLYEDIAGLVLGEGWRRWPTEAALGRVLVSVQRCLWYVLERRRLYRCETEILASR